MTKNCTMYERIVRRNGEYTSLFQAVCVPISTVGLAGITLFHARSARVTLEKETEGLSRKFSRHCESHVAVLT